MNAREAIKVCIDMGQTVCLGYIDDLTDEQLLVRPHPKCNHINWQIGHLIASERYMVEAACPGSSPTLPDGFDKQYSKENDQVDDPKAFYTKGELLVLFHEQRAATLAALFRLSDADLDKPAPEEMKSYAPTIAAVFDMQGTHWLMHAGQWAVVRRQLGKPPLF
jgi:hypothetical protein